METNRAQVLVIDDEPQIRKLLQINLESNDYKVIQASSAKEGLALAASHLPDAVLLDIGLPDKSGHELLKELKSWYNKPVVILSVIDNEEDIVRVEILAKLTIPALTLLYHENDH